MIPTNLGRRLEQLSQVMKDPPNVHEGAPGGVWKASGSAYEFIARHLPDEATTLETGLGISTVLFGQWSTSHVCVVGSVDQVDRLREYFASREIDDSHVRFEVGSSDRVLPTLDITDVDLYLIDGGHGFPHPAIDWYYGALRLVDGGIVVIDDIQLPSVHDYLIDFLDKDPRWVNLGGDHKWQAFQKDGDFSVREEWTQQTFLGASRLPLMSKTKIGVNRQLMRLKRK
jgi:hypothetical protein